MPSDGDDVVNDLRWQLPGVRNFVEKVANDLDGGASVIMHVPPHAPIDLSRRVERVCREEYRHLDWKIVDRTELRCTSVASIVNSLVTACGHRVDDATCVRSLAASARDRVYVVDQPSADDWLIFRDFLEQFRLVNHERQEGDRDVFFMTIPSILPVPVFDIGLQVRCWRGVVREIDSRLYVELMQNEVSDSDLKDLIRRRIAVELGGTDLDLVAFLSSKSIEKLIEPKSSLIQYCSENSWCAAAQSNWNDGAKDDFRGAHHVHSCVLARNADWKEVSHRVWHAQVATMFPYLERLRIRLIPNLKPFLRSHELRDQDGNPSELEDLELGSLVFFLRKTRAPSQLRNEITTLRDVRHELAHLRPVKSELMNRFLRIATSP